MGQCSCTQRPAVWLRRQPGHTLNKSRKCYNITANFKVVYQILTLFLDKLISLLQSVSWTHHPKRVYLHPTHMTFKVENTDLMFCVPVISVSLLKWLWVWMWVCLCLWYVIGNDDDVSSRRWSVLRTRTRLLASIWSHSLYILSPEGMIVSNRTFRLSS